MRLLARALLPALLLLPGLARAATESISQLPAAATVNLGDIVPCTQGSTGPGSGTTRKCAVQQVGTALGLGQSGVAGTLAQQNSGAVAITGGTVSGVAVNLGSTTGSLILPSGTTAQQPDSGSAGEVRFNSQTGRYEFGTGSAWQNHVRLGGDTLTGAYTGGTFTGGDVSGQNVTATGSTAARTLAARWSDALNLRDCGAAGDDTTDDTSAFTTCTGKGKPVRLPAGVYKLNFGGTFTPVTVPLIFDAGATLDLTGTTNLSLKGAIIAGRTQIFSNGTPLFFGLKAIGTAYPEWWGAVGDAAIAANSGTDDTTAFSRALSSGYWKFDLGSNLYRITSGLTVNQQTITFEGAAKFAGGLVFDDASGTGTLLDVKATKFAWRNASIWRAQAATGGTLIDIDHTSFAEIENAGLGDSNTFTALTVDSSNQTRIRNSRLQGTGDIVVLKAASSGTVLSDVFLVDDYLNGTNSTGACLNVSGYVRGIVDQGTSHYNCKWPLYMVATAGDSGNAAHKFQNSRFDTSTNGVVISGVGTTLFTNNWLSNNSAPATFTDDAGWTVSGNDFQGGLSLNGSSGMAVTGNHFSGLSSGIKLAADGSGNGNSTIAITGNDLAFASGVSSLVQVTSPTGTAHGGITVSGNRVQSGSGLIDHPEYITAGLSVQGVISEARDPTTADILPSECQDWNNTSAGTYKHICNVAGTLRSVALN